VYVSSWLKVYHPAEFACALLNSQPMGFYSASSIVQDAQRHGVTVLPVCVQHSRRDNTLEPDKTPVTVAGLVVGRQRPQTASGVMFVSVEDETGVANLVVTVPVFDAYRHALLHSKLILVRGVLEREGQVIHVLVREVERLELTLTGAEEQVELPARSRDFH
jgi:DNA polymerase III alpha subunit